MQERDEHAPIHPNTWGMLGGGVEDGEIFIEGAVRELQEESGLTGLDLVEALSFERPSAHPARGESRDQWRVYVTRAHGLTDADVVCGEGRQIIFRDPAVLDDPALAMPDFIRDLIRETLASPAFASVAP